MTTHTTDRNAQFTRTRRWAAFTVAWNVAEGVIAITAALIAKSRALIGFGLDSASSRSPPRCSALIELVRWSPLCLALLRDVMREPAVPRPPKIAPGVGLVYLAIPIDLIPRSRRFVLPNAGPGRALCDAVQYATAGHLTPNRAVVERSLAQGCIAVGGLAGD